MARARINTAVVSFTDGTPFAVATANVYLRNTLTLATLYAGETGVSTVLNPVNVIDGRIDVWVAEGSYDVTVDGPGITTYTFSFEAVSGIHHTAHEPGGADELTGLTDENIAVANKDGADGTPSMRTFGRGAGQAAKGAWIPQAAQQGLMATSDVAGNVVWGPPLSIAIKDPKYGAKIDAKRVTDGVISGGALDTVTSVTANWTAADIGKVILVDGGVTWGAVFQTTIASVTNVTTAVLTDPVPAATSGAWITWGTDDAPAFRAAATAAGISGEVFVGAPAPGAFGCLLASGYTSPSTQAALYPVPTVSTLGGGAFKVRGMGETISKFVLTPGCKRLFDLANSGTSSNPVNYADTYLHDLGVDGSRVGSGGHVFLGNYPINSHDFNMNVTRGYRLRSENLGQGAYSTGPHHQINIFIIGNAAWNDPNPKDLGSFYFEDCTFLGGNGGVIIGGQVSSGASPWYVNVNAKKVHLNNVYHDTLTPALTTTISNGGTALHGSGTPTLIESTIPVASTLGWPQQVGMPINGIRSGGTFICGGEIMTLRASSGGNFTVTRGTGSMTLSTGGPVGHPNIFVPGAVGVGDASITVNNGSYLAAAPSTMILDGEQIAYTNITGNVVSGLTRGANGTTPAAHIAGSPVGRLDFVLTHPDQSCIGIQSFGANNFQVMSVGTVDELIMENCTGIGATDSTLELNAASYVYLRNFRSVDPMDYGIAINNFRQSKRPQVIKMDRPRFEYLQSSPSGITGLCSGIALTLPTAATQYGAGETEILQIKDPTYYAAQDYAALNTVASRFQISGAVRRIDIEGLDINLPNVAPNQGNSNVSPGLCQLNPNDQVGTNVAVTANTGDATITLTDVSQLLPAGSVTNVAGTITISYTSIIGKVLQGCTWQGAGTQAAGALLLQSTGRHSVIRCHNFRSRLSGSHIGPGPSELAILRVGYTGLGELILDVNGVYPNVTITGLAALGAYLTLLRVQGINAHGNIRNVRPRGKLSDVAGANVKRLWFGHTGPTLASATWPNRGGPLNIAYPGRLNVEDCDDPAGMPTGSSDFFYDGSIVASAAPPPASLVATPSASGGSLADGSYRYVVSALNAVGETIASNEVVATIVAGGGSGSVALTWVAPSGTPSTTPVTGYRIYRSPVAGAVNSENVYYAPAGTAVAFTDTGAASTGGTPIFNGSVQSLVTISAGGQIQDADVGSPGITRYDRTFGQNGLITPQLPCVGITAVVVTASRALVNRFVPSRDMLIKKIAFVTAPAASVNDNVDVGIFNAALTTLIVSSGSTAGKLNATGVQTVTVSDTLLTAGTVYYVALAAGTVGGTAASLVSVNYQSGRLTEIFGSTAGTIDSSFQNTAFPLAAPFTITTPTSSAAPVLALRES